MDARVVLRVHARASIASREAQGAAGAAILQVDVQTCLTTVARICIAVAKPRVAFDQLADPIHAGGGHVDVGAYGAAGAAMPRVALQIRLTTVIGIAVAVGEARVAFDQRADPIHAGGGPVHVGAGCSAGAAIPRVAHQVCLTTVSGIAVAVTEARGAFGDHAEPGFAGGVCVGDLADRGAGATMAGVSVQVCLTTVGRIAVAVLEAHAALDPADTILAGRAAVVVGAGCAAVATMVGVTVQNCLAAVSQDPVAVGEARGAPDLAGTIHAGRAAIVVGALRVAGAAMVGVSAQVCFAAVSRIAVAVGEARVAFG